MSWCPFLTYIIDRPSQAKEAESDEESEDEPGVVQEELGGFAGDFEGDEEGIIIRTKKRQRKSKSDGLSFFLHFLLMIRCTHVFQKQAATAVKKETIKLASIRVINDNSSSSCN